MVKIHQIQFHSQNLNPNEKFEGTKQQNNVKQQT